MDTSDKLHQLLYYALINIRSEAHNHTDKVSFHLADLFHNAVLIMGQAARGERTYEEALDEIKSRAEEKGIGEWVDNHLTRIANTESTV